MQPQLQSRKPDELIQYLLKQGEQIEAERLRLRAEAGQRMTFFVSLTSAVLGGILIIGQAPNAGGLPQLLLIALMFLTIIGWQTFSYIVNRDISTDYFLRAGGRIRRYFSDQHPDIKPYVLLSSDDEPTKYVTRNDSSNRRTIQAILSLLVALEVAICVNIMSVTTVPSAIAGGLAFLAALLIFEGYAKRKFANAAHKAKIQVRFPKLSERGVGAGRVRSEAEIGRVAVDPLLSQLINLAALEKSTKS